DGKILGAGDSPLGSSSCNTFSYQDRNSLIFRLNTDGSLDTTFGTGGIVSANLATVGNCPDDGFRDVTLQSDGKIVATGYANTTQDGSTNAKNNISVARFNSNGTFDTTFDGDGKAWTNISSTAGFLSDIGMEVSVLTTPAAQAGKILVG